MFTKIIVAVLYILVVIGFYIFVYKRLNMLNKRHMKHIESVCLKRNYRSVMQIVSILFLASTVCSLFVIFTLL